jgi:DNA integrity scanning protein DisA with diadenylate cyclase activity
MDFLYYISKFLPFFWLLRWYDGIEIICYSVVIYYFSVWLASDKQKNLVLPFYGYCLALCASQLLGFFSVNFLLMYAAPFVFMLFILLHQQILQKNFITLSKVHTKIELVKNDWIEVLMRGCLHAVNTNKQLLVVIEQHDMLQPYLAVPFLVNASLEIELLEVLIDSPRFDASKMIVIESSGHLKSINASWRCELNTMILEDELLESWQKYSLAITHKTDALILQIQPEERLFTLIMQGKMMQHLPAATVVTLLKNITQYPKENKKNGSSSLKGVFNESFAQKSSFEQTQS